MEAILKEINGVVGVTGSFICLNDGSVAAQAVPASFGAANVAQAARVAIQTFHALEASGRHIAEADLMFEQGRLLLKNLRGGILVIICARQINVALLNLTATVAAKKIADELKPGPPPIKEPVAGPLSAPAPLPVVSPPPLAQPADYALFTELEQAWQQIVNAADQSKATLRAMGALAVWLRCPHARGLLALPDKKQLDFAARSAQRETIRRILEQLGYQNNQAVDEFFSSPHLYFSNLARDISVDILLDTFTMYHHFDLAPFMSGDNTPLPDTALLLTRLQLVEMPESGLRELSALLLAHDPSLQPEPDKIDLAPIVRICADDWGWYKTVTLNLQHIMAFAVKTLTSDDKATIVERAEHIRQAIESAPKNLRWQARARVGEGMRWYDIPSTTSAEQRNIGTRYGD